MQWAFSIVAKEHSHENYLRYSLQLSLQLGLAVNDYPGTFCLYSLVITCGLIC